MARRVYSFDALTDKISEDLSWRRKELQLIKEQIPSVSSPKQSASLRSSVPILYAHWEGFTKKCCELYLEYVAGKYIKHNELKPQFVALSLTKKLGKLEIKNLEEKTKTVELLINEMDKNSNIQTKNIIQTRSNLRYSVFQEIMFSIDLDESIFLTYSTLIDDLVDARNNIAHGQYLRVDYQTYLTMHSDTQTLMETLKTEVENSALQENFRRLVTGA